MSNAIRWGLVTFMTGVTCGTFGYFLPDSGVAFSVPALSFFAAVLGAAAISDWDGK